MILRATLWLTAVSLLSGCTDPLAESRTITSNRDYDLLASCFTRHAQEQANSMELVTMERFSDIKEIRVNRTLHFLWAPAQPVWQINFQPTGDNHTKVEIKGAFAIRNQMYRDQIAVSLQACGTGT